MARRDHTLRAGVVRRSSIVAALGVLILALLPFVNASAFSPGVHFSSTASSTWQTNGVVWAVGQSRGKVIAGGTFTQLRAPDGGTGTAVNVNGLAIFDAETGAPDSCQLGLGSATGTVRAITTSADGGTVYVAGDFGSIGGVSGVGRVAAIDVQACKVLPFRPAVPSSIVWALALHDNTLYMGGGFQTVAGQQRLRFAALDATTGALLPWVADADATGRAVAVSPDGSKVAIGGEFFNVNGAYSHSIAVVDAATGANLRTYPAGFIPNTSVTHTIYSGDDGRFYVGNEGSGGGVFDGRFAVSWSTLDQVWRDTCLGATQAVLEYKGTLYSASHAHNCSPGGFNGFQDGKRNFFMAERADNADLLGWDPRTNDGINEGIGPRAMTVATGRTTLKDYLWYGGEFTTVNGKPQQGLTRFGPDNLTKPPIPVPVAQPVSEGGIQVRWRSVVDSDDSELTYSVFRNGGTTPIWTGQASSVWWKRPQVTFVDKDVTPGATYTYKVSTSDGTNVSAKSATVTGTALAPAGSYASSVRGDSPTVYWDGRASTTWEQEAGATQSDTRRLSGLLVNGPVLGTGGAVANDTSGSNTFDGTDDYAWNDEYVPAPSTYTVEAWIKTTSTRGGKIIGYGDGRPRTDTGATQLSGSYDRHLYMDSGQRVAFGAYSGTATVLRSPSALNDGQWHQVVGTQGANGMALFVDGKRVATNGISAAQSYRGVWHVGGDNLSSWPNRPLSNFFGGQIDEVAVYPEALTASHVAAHYRAGGGTVAAKPRPTDTYGAAVYDADPETYWRLDEASGTTAADSSYLGNNPGTYGAGVSKGQTGVVAGNRAASVVGNATSTIASAGTQTAPRAFSAEGWFKTASASGGKIFGFENPAGTSYDKMLYMSAGGRLNFGTQTGTTRSVLSTTTSFNDNSWHHAVATQNATGTRLYVDGTLVGSNTVATSLTVDGIWRVGGGAVAGWQGAPTSGNLTGTVDEFAAYPRALGAAEVAAHYGYGLNDTQAPTTPTGLTGTTSGTSVQLSWTASSDNVQVTRYSIYRGSSADFTPSPATLQGESTSASYTQTAAAGTYYYKVVAADGAGNASDASDPATVAVADTTAPSQPTRLTATPSGNGGVTASWTASTDDVAVTGYDVHRGASADFVPGDANKVGSTPSNTFADANVPRGTVYYKVVARDAAGNSGTPSEPAVVDITDYTSPSVVTGLAATVDGGAVSLGWDASTDDTAVTAYHVHRGTSADFTPSDANRIADPVSTSYVDTVASGGTFYYKVTASDAAGNTSNPSTAVRADVVDQTAPTAPTGVGTTVVGTSVKIDWNAATDAFGVTGYTVHRGTTAGFTADASTKIADATATTYTDSPVPAGTYFYKVRAKDGAGNLSDPSDPSQATVTAAPGQPVTVTLSPTDDALVASAATTTNYGTNTQLAARSGAPAQESLLKFTLPAAPAGTTLTQARLTVRTSTDATSNTTDPTELRIVGNGWNEGAVTWANRPTGTGTLFGTLASAPTTNTAYPITGDSATLTTALGGDLTLRASTTGTGADNLRLWSKEATSTTYRPTLTLTFTPQSAPGDTQAPTTPGGLTAAVTDRSVSLGWDASTDDTAVTAYHVHRGTSADFTPSDANRIADPVSTSYVDTVASGGTFYYKVTASDAAGNTSNPSTAVRADVVDQTAPTAPTGVGTTVVGTSVKIDWNAATDAFGVTGYTVHRGTTAGFTADASTKIADATATTYTDSPVPAGTYFYKVRAKDGAGNLSDPSDPSQATVTAAPGQPVTVTLSPTDDALVASAATTTNYGTNTQLAARSGAPAQESLLKFTLPAAPAGTTLTQARLTVRTSTDATSNTTDPTELRIVGNGWNEGAVTWANRPTGTGTLFGTLASAPTTNTAYPITGDSATLTTALGGDLTLRASTTGTGADNLRLWSKEATSTTYRPTLTLTFTP